MATITTHVLDTARGKPAAGIAVRLERLAAPPAHPGQEQATRVADGKTDDDGRCKTLTPSGVAAGTYRLTFETGPYFQALGLESFFPVAHIVFVVSAASETQHFHVPLLLAPFSYSTYRGS